MVSLNYKNKYKQILTTTGRPHTQELQNKYLAKSEKYPIEKHAENKSLLEEVKYASAKLHAKMIGVSVSLTVLFQCN